MDSRIGLDYIVENREYAEKLGTALDTTNITVKKQVFELLSALCAYNGDGYMRAIATLEHYKVSGRSGEFSDDMRSTQQVDQSRVCRIRMDKWECHLANKFVGLLDVFVCLCFHQRLTTDRNNVRNDDCDTITALRTIATKF